MGSWRKNGTPDTLTVAGDTMTISDLTKAKFNQFLESSEATGGTIASTGRFGTGSIDSGSNYAYRVSTNGASDNTTINDTELSYAAASALSGETDFTVIQGINLPTKEKLFIAHNMISEAAGVGVAPSRAEFAGKWVNTVDQFDQSQIFNNGGGDFAIDSNLSALASIDPTPAVIVGGWKELGRTTLGSANANIDVTGLADKRYYMILTNLDYTASLAPNLRLNSISTGTYAYRRSDNGSNDQTFVSQTEIPLSNASITPNFGVGYAANLSAKEKLIILHSIEQQTAGAANVPDRRELVGKHAQTTNPITAFNLVASASTFKTGSELVVLGWDPDDTHTDNFWEELASVDQSTAVSTYSSGTFASKKYLWVQLFITDLTANSLQSIRFNNDTGNNYATRLSTNGAADATNTSANNILTGSFTDDNPKFVNMFIINNETEEKMVTSHMIEQDTSGAAVPPRYTEMVGKWANTANQITEIDVNNSSGNSAGKIRVWGHD